MNREIKDSWVKLQKEERIKIRGVLGMHSHGDDDHQLEKFLLNFGKAAGEDDVEVLFEQASKKALGEADVVDKEAAKEAKKAAKLAAKEAKAKK